MKSLFVLVLLVAILVPLLNMIPTWHGYSSEAPPERVFLGFRTLAMDHYQYASFVRQVTDEGRFFLENRFTSEEQSPRYVLLYLWVVGMFCRVTGLGLVLVWEIFRVGVGTVFLLTAWVFTGKFFKETKERLCAYLFIAFSGGVGWVLWPLTGHLPPGMDAVRNDIAAFWAWSTFGTMTVPMWIAALLLLLVCAMVLAGDESVSFRSRWTLGLVVPPLIWFIHPYTGMVSYLTFTFFAVMPVVSAVTTPVPVDWRALRHNLDLAAPFISSFVIVALYLLWARMDPVFAATSSTIFSWNPTYSIYNYPLGYGLLMPLAWFGAKWSALLDEKPRQILFAWLASAFLLAVNPFFAGVKFQSMLHFPLALLAAFGFLELRRRSTKVRTMVRGISGAFLGVLLFGATLYGVFCDFPTTVTDKEIYLSAPEIKALNFLDSQPPGVVLSMPWIGNRIPWLSSKTVFAGHWFLTPDFNRTKAPQIMAFFNPSVSAAPKKEFLQRNTIRYVYFGREENSVGTVAPELGLTIIYTENGITVYKTSP